MKKREGEYEYSAGHLIGMYSYHIGVEDLRATFGY